MLVERGHRNSESIFTGLKPWQQMPIVLEGLLGLAFLGPHRLGVLEAGSSVMAAEDMAAAVVVYRFRPSELMSGLQGFRGMRNGCGLKRSLKLYCWLC
jgi:hypothetical protein